MYRLAEAGDLWDWRELRNDPDALFWSGNREEISLADHDKWYSRVRHDPSHYLAVHQQDGLDAGRVDGYGRLQLYRDAEVSFGVAAAMRGRGYGRGMLDHLEVYARNAHIERLIGYVHPSNLPSMRAFALQGYYIDTNYKHYEKLVKIL